MTVGIVSGRGRARDQFGRGNVPPALAATRALGVSLNRWAGHRAVRAKYAAIARERLKPRTAALAVVEELASIRWHRFRRLTAALGASDR
jgi:hypothetical protein